MAFLNIAAGIVWHIEKIGVSHGPSLSDAPLAQLDRASDYESEGRTFESSRVRFPQFFVKRVFKTL